MRVGESLDWLPAASSAITADVVALFEWSVCTKTPVRTVCASFHRYAASDCTA